ncbi:MAG: flagellar basal body P-ring protein FlgI [Burkholderiales bacterium]|nr:flagellar basal body P-ring protein FlgI [Burkholderiales bacterium]
MASVPFFSSSSPSASAQESPGLMRAFIASAAQHALKLVLLCVFLTFLLGNAHATRIKDLAGFSGVRGNQLIGYGLVVGLDGSGDQTTQTPFTVQSLTTMLTQLGVNLPPGTNLQLKNVAAVVVTASLPPFAQPGQTLDVTVSSLGNAKSLRGGTLLMTPLKGADGNVYAIAQGNVAVGGAGASAGGSKTQINHLSAGRVPAGATVERSVPTALGESGVIQLELHRADFSTATRMADVINQKNTGAPARAMDARTVMVSLPRDAHDRVAFLAGIENLPVTDAIGAARVIINARTGSVIFTQAVKLEPCAVAHGSLSVTISSTPEVSQPNPLGLGQTAVTNKTDIQIKQDGTALMHLKGGADLGEVVKALNTLGANPQDLLAILQAMQTAGALKAELEII